MNKFIYGFRYKYMYEVNEKVVLFESCNGEQCDSNLRSIYEVMLGDERYKEFTFAWAFIDTDNYNWLGGNPRTLVIKSGTKKYYRYYASARYILTDRKLKLSITLKKEQMHIRIESENSDENRKKIEKNVLDSMEAKTITLQTLLERAGLFLFKEINLSDNNDSGLWEHQKMAVEALRKLKDICDKHQLSFYLLAGSTLGAVRHKGMIPWDDDIDVGFLYEGWQKIRKILSQELRETKFVYMDDAVNDMFPRLHGKILYEGRNCVDIFLIAKWTSNPVLAGIHWKIRKLTVELYKISVNWKRLFMPFHSTKYRVKYYLKHFVLKFIYYISRMFFDKKDYVKLARWNEKRFEKKETDCYINLYSLYKMQKEKMRAEWIDQPSEVEFEGNIYQTVGDVDAYLRQMYGNYMELPPLSKRMAGHFEKFSF